MKRPPFIKQFNWRVALMRVVINAAVLAATALILPNIYFVEVTVWNILFVSIVLGILNAVVKPIIQFLTLSFIFTTYGLVVVLINAIILLLLSWLFPDRFVVESILAALIGGALVGILGSFFESLLGLSPPIIPDKADEFRKRPVDQAPIVTQMILKTGHEEEPALADPAEPLPANHQNGVSEGAEEPGLNRAQEREVEEGERAMEDDTMSVDDDLESADTLEQAADQAPEAGDDDPNETPAQKQENESWQ
jgi:putative membrane protein